MDLSDLEKLIDVLKKHRVRSFRAADGTAFVFDDAAFYVQAAPETPEAEPVEPDLEKDLFWSADPTLTVPG